MEENFEVPSPHEHAIEEAVEKDQQSLTQKIALMTAVLATVGAIVSYQSGSAQNEAMFLKNLLWVLDLIISIIIIKLLPSPISKPM